MSTSGRCDIGPVVTAPIRSAESVVASAPKKHMPGTRTLKESAAASARRKRSRLLDSTWRAAAYDRLAEISHRGSVPVSGDPPLPTPVSGTS
jgi:hypothetical protein